MEYRDFIERLSTAIDNEEMVMLAIGGSFPESESRFSTYFSLDLDSSLCDLDYTETEAVIYLTDGNLDFNIKASSNVVTESDDGYKIEMGVMEIYVDFRDAN